MTRQWCRRSYAKKVSREEVFGPVAVLIPHKVEEDAIRIPTHSAYGLAGSVFMADDADGVGVARRVRIGTFSVNRFVSDLGSPFGGYRSRVLGRKCRESAGHVRLHANWGRKAGGGKRSRKARLPLRLQKKGW